MTLHSRGFGTPEEQAAILVETLVAALIVLTLVVSVYAALASGFAILKSERESLRATQILLQKEEAIRLCSWSQLSNCPSSFQEYFDPSGSSNHTAGVLYSGTITMGTPTNIPNTVSYRSNIQSVTMTLSWATTNKGIVTTHSRTSQTQVALSGLETYVWGH